MTTTLPYNCDTTDPEFEFRFQERMFEIEQEALRTGNTWNPSEDVPFGEKDYLLELSRQSAQKSMDAHQRRFFKEAIRTGKYGPVSLYRELLDSMESS